MIFQNITEHQAYDTHFNYIKCLCSLTKGTTLQYTGSLRKASLPDIDEKKNLIDLTKKSLTDEHKIVGIDRDYSYASTSWLPIKAYYLIFNILLTIEYIIKIQKSAFSRGHHPCVEEFTRKCTRWPCEKSRTTNLRTGKSITTSTERRKPIKRNWRNI